MKDQSVLDDAESSVVNTVLKMSDSSVNRKVTMASKFIDKFGVATGVLAAISIGWLIHFFSITKPDRDQDRKDRAAETQTRVALGGAVEVLKVQSERTNSVLLAIEGRLTAIDGTLKNQSAQFDGQSRQKEEHGRTLHEIATGQREVLELLKTGPIRIKPMPEE